MKKRRLEKRLEMRISPLHIRNLKEATRQMTALGVDRYGVKIMAPKAIFKAFKIEGINSYAANIVKQHLLSLGSDAALSRSCLVKRGKTDIAIFGTLSQLNKFLGKIKNQPFGLKELAVQLRPFLNTQDRECFFSARGKRLWLKKCVICGILNVTPDSFSGDGLLTSTNTHIVQEKAVRQAAEMIKYGVKMLDVGGESTRPFSKAISEEEELKRVLPVIKAVRREFKDTILSIDTYKYKVAKEAVGEGVDIINDITALRHSPGMITLIKKYKLGCILMHMKGTPRTMQRKPRYKKEVVSEIVDFLERRVTFCGEHGVDKTQLMVDPGIGFGKCLEDNVEIINRLHEFKSLGLPIFLGLSRKSFIGAILGVGVQERLSGTIASSILSLLGGVNVLRVHDVREIHQALCVVDKITNH